MWVRFGCGGAEHPILHPPISYSSPYFPSCGDAPEQHHPVCEAAGMQSWFGSEQLLYFIIVILIIIIIISNERMEETGGWRKQPPRGPQCKR